MLGFEYEDMSATALFAVEVTACHGLQTLWESVCESNQALQPLWFLILELRM